MFFLIHPLEFVLCPEPSSSSIDQPIHLSVHFVHVQIHLKTVSSQKLIVVMWYRCRHIGMICLMYLKILLYNLGPTIRREIIAEVNIADLSFMVLIDENLLWTGESK